MRHISFFDTDGFERHLPARWIICDRCRGDGTHDCWDGGMSRDEFDEMGPEFFEDYMAGMYSVPCTVCRGAGKVLDVDSELANGDDLIAYAQHLADEADYRAIVAAEMRMGA